MKNHKGKLTTSRILLAHVEQRKARFEVIKKLVNSGQYKVNVQATAEKLARALDTRISLVKQAQSEI